MINRIHISNFLLIDHLELELNAGFTTITGETGAGKSILLGALGLVLGNRADLSQVKNNEKKCIVEVSFTKANENVSGFFEREDFDFDQLIILRREISPSGKSRAFINDTPASLSQLKELGEYLVDLHSQFANLEIRKRSFLFFVIDVYSGNQKLLAEYQKRYEHFLELTEEIKKLES